MKLKHLFLPLLVLAFLVSACEEKQPELPNILWITSEDNSPLLGCYGDEFATTPNLDQLAMQDFMEFLGYTIKEFWSIVDGFWNREIFVKDGVHWRMKVPRFPDE